MLQAGQFSCSGTKFPQVRHCTSSIGLFQPQFLHASSRGPTGCEQPGHCFSGALSFREGRKEMMTVSRGKRKQARIQNRMFRPFFAAIKPPMAPAII